MSHKVVVLPSLELPPPSNIGIELDDESALAMKKSEGTLTSAIAPAGPHAVFNHRQVERLVSEIRDVSKHQPRVIQVNLNEVAEYIEEHTGARDHRYVIFFSI